MERARGPAPRVRILCRRIAVKKTNSRTHRKRGKSSRRNAKLKAKHRRVRVRRSSGERNTYR